MKPGKPVFGSPCNGCGRCCLSEQCPISKSIFGLHPYCPALQEDGERYRCGLLAQPEVFWAADAEVHRRHAFEMLCGTAEASYCDSVSNPDDFDAFKEMEAAGTLYTPSAEMEQSYFIWVILMGLDLRR